MSFGIFETKKNTTNNTTNYNDSSANAGGDNSLAVGQGANLMTASGGGIVTGSGPVNIQTSDPETVARSLAFAAANDRETTDRYLATLNTLQGDRTLSAQQQYETQGAAQRTIDASNQLAAAVLDKPYTSDTRAIAATDTISSLGKYAGYAAVAVAVIYGLYYYSKHPSK